VPRDALPGAAGPRSRERRPRLREPRQPSHRACCTARGGRGGGDGGAAGAGRGGRRVCPRQAGRWAAEGANAEGPRTGCTAAAAWA
jgi:hypothetical protein